MHMDNNLFDFAASELSQDAVICWCVNWFNFKDSALWGLGRDMLHLICPKLLISDSEDVIIIRQWHKTDILLYFRLSGNAVIIEDKVYTTEHDDQINTYINKINSLPEKEKSDLDVNSISPEKLYTTYFKTGFFYDCDKKVATDFTVTGDQFLEIINRHKEKNIILEYFSEHLSNIISWYDTYGSINISNISDHQIAQYKLMRYIFNESLWDRKNSLYEVYHGSNRDGSPWTEMTVFKGKFKDNRSYSIFWRIDKDSKGPYLSLRFYDGEMDKNNPDHTLLHCEIYEKMRNICQSICSEMKNPVNWKDISYRDTCRYKESTLARFELTNVINNWNDINNAFKSVILEYNDMFASFI